jgi:hypothetical protein
VFGGDERMENGRVVDKQSEVMGLTGEQAA